MRDNKTELSSLESTDFSGENFKHFNFKWVKGLSNYLSSWSVVLPSPECFSVIYYLIHLLCDIKLVHGLW